MWGATYKRCRYPYLILISIHAPMWGATRLKRVVSHLSKFQSTHPCGVRPIADSSWAVVYISIHAPMWGATLLEKLDRQIQQFQSTHPCGVRRSTASILSAMLIFQSTHPCGVRQYLYHQKATYNHFNPRTHVGCDGKGFCNIVDGYIISIHAPV